MSNKSSVCRVVWSFSLLLQAHSYGEVVYGSVLNIADSKNIGGMFLNWSCNAPEETVCFSSLPITERDSTVSSSTGTFAQYNGTVGLIANVSGASQPVDVTFLAPTTLSSTGAKIPSDTCAGLPDCASSVQGSPNPSAVNPDTNSTGTVQYSSGVTVPISGTFATEIAMQTPQPTQASILAAGSSGLPADSAQVLLSPVPVAGDMPEPATLALCGAGLLALGILRMRRRRE